MRMLVKSWWDKYHKVCGVHMLSLDETMHLIGTEIFLSKEIDDIDG